MAAIRPAPGHPWSAMQASYMMRLAWGATPERVRSRLIVGAPIMPTPLATPSSTSVTDLVSTQQTPAGPDNRKSSRLVTMYSRSPRGRTTGAPFVGGEKERLMLNKVFGCVMITVLLGALLAMPQAAIAAQVHEALDIQLYG